jgi:Flp pilus assembly protein CpaB
MPVSVIEEPIGNRDEAVTLLDSIGRRRRALRSQEDTLREDTRTALRATAGHVSRAEAARLTALNRSTIYELYLGDRDEAADRESADAGESDPHEPRSAEATG